MLGQTLITIHHRLTIENLFSSRNSFLTIPTNYRDSKQSSKNQFMSFEEILDKSLKVLLMWSSAERQIIKSRILNAELRERLKKT